jgi:hypothetical protein
VSHGNCGDADADADRQGVLTKRCRSAQSPRVAQNA